MSQHDMNLANAGGAAFRADANNALSALVGNSSGATEPSTMFAYQFWADTSAGILKQRNAANSAWINIYTLGAGVVSVAGGNLTGGINGALSTVASAAAPDIFATTVGNLINYTGTTTCTGFTAAPQAGAERTLVCSASAAFTAGANMLIDGINSGYTLNARAGDKVVVYAVTTTQFRLSLMKYQGGGRPENTATGLDALYSNTTGSYNTASGQGALYSNTTGSDNTASGQDALVSNTTGTHNTASGQGALYSNTTGYQNTASGHNALYYNTTGTHNAASGQYALRSNTTGTHNAASGQGALYSNTTGYRNAASGQNALYYNTTGYLNTASGAHALYSNTTGYYNTASGQAALDYNTTGNFNTASGQGALSSNTTYSNCSGFGFDTQVTGSNQVQLGNSSTTTYVYGAVQNRSDLRDKADVADTTLGLEFIKSLRPVDYRWDMRDDYRPEAPEAPNLQKPMDSESETYEADLAAYEAERAAYEELRDAWLIAVKPENLVHNGSKKRTRLHHGFIAQEVMALNAGFGGVQDHGINGGEDVLSIGYDELIAPLVKAIQELSAELAAYKAAHP